MVRAWLWLAHRRFARAEGASNVWEARHRLVAELAPGRTFLDLGGMFSIDGEIAFRAEEAGAKSVVLLDGADPSDEFVAKHRKRGSDVRYVQGDLHDAAGMAELGQFDVVWCSGVIYHSPNPYLQLEHLRNLTREHLMLGTHVIPEIPWFPQACLWYPDIPEWMQREFARAHGQSAGNYWGMSAPFNRDPRWGYVNFWWGFTLSALHSMLNVARLDVKNVRRHSPFLVDVVASPRDDESLIPDVDFARLRGEARRDELAGDRAALWSQPLSMPREPQTPS